MDDSPRKPEIVLQELQELRNIFNQGSDIFRQHPADATLQMLLSQDVSRLKELSEELAFSYAHHRRHVLKIIFKNIQEYSSIPIGQFTSTLSMFSKLLDTLSKQVLSIPKAPLGLNFSTTFAGSFGILMNTDYDHELISEFTSVATTLFEYLNQMCSSESDLLIKFISTKLASNKKVVRAFRSYFQVQSDNANDIQVEWADPDQRSQGVYIDHQTSYRIYNLLKTFEGFPEVAVDKIGKIRGISLIRHSIEFVPEDDHRLIKAHYDKNMDEIVKPYLDKRARAVFLLKKQLNETTDEIIEEWQLKDIEEIGPPLN